MYTLFSVDDHIVEPSHVWTDRVPAESRDKAPHVVEVDGRRTWEWEGGREPTMGLDAVAGEPREEWGTEPARFEDMTPGCCDPEERAGSAVQRHLRQRRVPDAPWLRRSQVRDVRGQGPVARLRAGLERLRGGRVVRGGARHVRPHAHPGGLGRDGMAASTDVPVLYGHSRYFPLARMNMLPDLDTEPGTEYAPVPRLKETEFADTVLFLASDEARYTTGVTLPVDAGNTNKP
jgi:hypothetical protein